MGTDSTSTRLSKSLGQKSSPSHQRLTSPSTRLEFDLHDLCRLFVMALSFPLFHKERRSTFHKKICWSTPCAIPRTPANEGNGTTKQDQPNAFVYLGRGAEK